MIYGRFSGHIALMQRDALTKDLDGDRRRAHGKMVAIRIKEGPDLLTRVTSSCQLPLRINKPYWFLYRGCASRSSNPY